MHKWKKWVCTFQDLLKTSIESLLKTGGVKFSTRAFTSANILLEWIISPIYLNWHHGVIVMCVGVCCSVQCGRTGCSLWATLTQRTQRSRRSPKWSTTYSVYCFTMPSSMSGEAGACGWTHSPSPTPRLELSAFLDIFSFVISHLMVLMHSLCQWWMKELLFLPSPLFGLAFWSC